MEHLTDGEGLRNDVPDLLFIVREMLSFVQEVLFIIWEMLSFIPEMLSFVPDIPPVVWDMPGVAEDIRGVDGERLGVAKDVPVMAREVPCWVLEGRNGVAEVPIIERHVLHDGRDGRGDLAGLLAVAEAGFGVHVGVQGGHGPSRAERQGAPLSGGLPFVWRKNPMGGNSPNPVKPGRLRSKSRVRCCTGA